MEPAQLAKTARASLAEALGALQSADDAPDELLEAAEPIAKTMGILHKIERSHGAVLDGRDVALKNVRKVLADVQALDVDHPAVDTVLEAVAASLAKVNALAKYKGTAAPAPAAQPAPQPVVEAPKPAPAQPPQAAEAPKPLPAQPPQAAEAPKPAPAQPLQAAEAPKPLPAQPLQAAEAPKPAPAQPLQAAEAPKPAPAQPLQAAEAPKPAPEPPPHPVAVEPAPQPVEIIKPAPVLQIVPEPAPQPVAEIKPAPILAPQPVVEVKATPAPQPVKAKEPAPTPAPAKVQPTPAPAKVTPAPASVKAKEPTPPPGTRTVDVELGTHSSSNFYKGLSGNDVIEHGGIFVSTYRIPKLGAEVQLRVLLPGDYEFYARAVVQWTRESSGSSEPGFGARFTQIGNEGRQLVYRYARNREPMFYDDL
ncbi:hypothetical protein [Polyangium fumosum]|uniref:PilZ domain-containing protein n=1 Tax=Polyangium fumosum TaxID=889272 RepID=A0A4U1IZL9_9BACT|nr:hypothetical protein [Polyangium fumosum]TKD00180.1 hypothetical protein E8A74_35230 [Polyangium fumosum]